MYMSQIASNSPTPRSTSRVMMTGLIGPDLRREDCWSGPSHDDWRKTCLMESWRKTWHIPSKHGYYIYGVPPTILWTFQDGRPASAGGPAGAARRRAVLMRDFSGGGGTTGCALWRGQIDRPQIQRLVDSV